MTVARQSVLIKRFKIFINTHTHTCTKCSYTCAETAQKPANTKVKERILPVLLGVALSVSESMPFVSSLQHNGIIETLLSKKYNAQQTLNNDVPTDKSI